MRKNQLKNMRKKKLRKMRRELRNKQGFTLIELLGVIVILSIIALIATPIILNVIEEAKKGAFQNTAYGIVQAGELEYARQMLQTDVIEGVVFTYVDGVEEATPSGRQLQYKGTKPESGTVILNDKGNVALAVYDGNYCVEKDYQDSIVILTEKPKDECQIAIP